MIIELSQEQALDAKKAIGYAIGKIRQKMRWMERHAHTHTHRSSTTRGMQASTPNELRVWSGWSLC